MKIPYTELTRDALDGLISQYITQEHGLNDVEDPSTHYNSVYQAVVAGELVVIFSKIRCKAWLSPNHVEGF